MIHARSDAEIRLDLMDLSGREEWDANLRLYFAILGGGAVGVADALALGDLGAEPFESDLDDPEVAKVFAKALADVRTERQRRDDERDDAIRRAAGLLSVARARGQVRETIA